MRWVNEIQTTLIFFSGRSKYLTTGFFAKVCVNSGGYIYYYIGLSNILKLTKTTKRGEILLKRSFL